MKLTNEQIKAIITAICTLITTIAAIILTTACTMSLSVSKTTKTVPKKPNKQQRIVTGKQIGRASCRERVSSPV